LVAVLRFITRLVLLLVLGVLAPGEAAAFAPVRVWPPAASAEKLASGGSDPETAVLRQAAAMQAAETQQAASSLGYDFASGRFLAAESGLAREMGILREAAKGTGNYGLGTATRAEAVKLGEAWVGKGYKVASDGKTLISADGLKQFRPPSPKASSFATTGTQANFEIRSEFGKAWSGNGHLNIVDP